MEAFGLFSTPVFVLDPPNMAAFCADVTQRLLAERAKSPGVQASNLGGAWHSTPDLAQRSDPLWQRTVQEVIAGARHAFNEVAASLGIDTTDLDLDYAVQMWGMVIPTGGYATVHAHGDADWSVAFYMDAGDADLEADPASGTLSFIDPRRVPPTGHGVPLFPSTFNVRPVTGQLVVFPGWLQHHVHPYRGTRPRVTLSANLKLEKS